MAEGIGQREARDDAQAHQPQVEHWWRGNCRSVRPKPCRDTAVAASLRDRKFVPSLDEVFQPGNQGAVT